MKTVRLFSISILLFLSHQPSLSVGRIIIVHGSDTSIRSGLDVQRYHITAKADLYVAPALAAYRVMNPAYRSQITDSYGHPLIMTWWMLCGGIFRYGDNNNVPYPNLLPLHLMHTYHGAAMQQFGDELTLHYHTWKWSDLNGDGRWYWNQSETFNELREDFDFTLAQGLLEENMFPVSFRSGWHYMDNCWQQYLDELLPYSLHNDAPNIHADNLEPVDNVYDWSRGTLEWQPYRPSPTDYQVRGNGRGWNVRSSSMLGVSRATLEQAFIKASQGQDQVLCLWDHLAADDFFTSLERVNGWLHQLSTQYAIPFEFKTAVGAMQIWRRTQDTLKPSLTFRELHNGAQVSYFVQTDEPIFQRRPFVAVKTRSEQFIVAQMESVGTNIWRTVHSFVTDSIAKAACAVTDTAGNLTTEIKRYAPDDVFIDNSSSGYHELHGTWRTIATDTWGVDSRAANVNPNDSAAVEWQLTVPEARPYKVFVQQPTVAASVAKLQFIINNNGTTVGTRFFSSPLPANMWVYLGSYTLTLSTIVSIRMTGYAGGAAADLGADVIKLSPLVQHVELATTQSSLEFNFASLNDTMHTTLFLENRGLTNETVTAFIARDFRIVPRQGLPIAIPSGTSREIPVDILFNHVGPINDTLIIRATATEVRMPVSATVEYFVRVVDNEDAGAYFESGSWSTSVAVAYGRTSRYTFLNQGPAQFAHFRTSVPETGYYDVQEIVPSSTNSTDNAQYTISSDGRVLNTLFIDQRQTTNRWVSLGAFRFQAGAPIEIRVSNTGVYTAGDVLRADAIKLVWIDAAQLRYYTVDNDSAGYAESGTWARSVAQAYGPSSRFSLIETTTGQYASFTTRVLVPGRYDVRQIVPASANATNHALYTIAVDGTVIGSVYKDQRPGGWVSLGTFGLPAGRDIEVRVTHVGGNTEGNVLRADAVMLLPLVTGVVETTSLPTSCALEQNYPNPFNPSTIIRFAIPITAPVTLKIYDMLGREVATLVNEDLPAGIHDRLFTAQGVASGVYLYRLQSGSFSRVKKMIVLK